MLHCRRCTLPRLLNGLYVTILCASKRARNAFYTKFMVNGPRATDHIMRRATYVTLGVLSEQNRDYVDVKSQIAHASTTAHHTFATLIKDEPTILHKSANKCAGRVSSSLSGTTIC